MQKFENLVKKIINNKRFSDNFCKKIFFYCGKKQILDKFCAALVLNFDDF